MNKIIVIFSAHRTLESGGVGTHLRHLIDEVKKSNYEYYVLLGTKKHRQYKRAFLNIISYLIKGNNYKAIDYFMNHIYSLTSELNSLLKNINNEDTEFVLHCHDRLTVFAASLLADKYNIKIIQTLHAPFAEQYEISHPKDKLFQKFTKILDPGILLETNSLIAVDALQAQIVESKLDRKLKTKEIINAVDIDIKISQDSYISKTYKVDQYIVVARHLHRKNGVEFAIKAFEKLKGQDIYLFIVGQGPEKEPLTKLTNKLGISEKVFFIGAQPHEISLNIIAHAKLSLVPSIPVGIYIEAASLTMLESMLLKTPVIASNIGGLKQVLTDNETGILVPPGDVDSLTVRVSEMLTNQELYNKISDNAYKVVTERYNTAKWFSDIKNIYDTI